MVVKHDVSQQSGTGGLQLVGNLWPESPQKRPYTETLAAGVYVCLFGLHRWTRSDIVLVSHAGGPATACPISQCALKQTGRCIRLGVLLKAARRSNS